MELFSVKLFVTSAKQTPSGPRQGVTILDGCLSAILLGISVLCTNLLKAPNLHLSFTDSHLPAIGKIHPWSSLISPDDQSLVCTDITIPSPHYSLVSGETWTGRVWVSEVRGAHCTRTVSPDRVSEEREPLSMLPGDRYAAMLLWLTVIWSLSVKPWTIRS